MAEKHFESEDPFSLNGVIVELPPGEARRAEEEMAACFIEEYLMLGRSEDEIMGLFRDPFYRGTHAVYRGRGEDFVRDLIREVRDGKGSLNNK